ncbi:MAG: hypothetical protein RL404_2852 [Pseudomonadota bacterium]|jgi:hypothetical protein
MRVAFALTSRLVMITSVCGVAIVVLLVMLGFELGLREAHAEFDAQAKARGEGRADLQADAHGRDGVGYMPVAAPTPSAALYSATDPSKGK